MEWYDLQSELVDHLANAIETQWQENPKLSFNEALNKEFKFGVLVLWMWLKTSNCLSKKIQLYFGNISKIF
jgi:hypothetical protein